MPTFYLSGQRTFANRGCEAIVRTTVGMLRQLHPDAVILVPSDNISSDAAQWPEHESHGVEFVPAFTPAMMRPWAHAQRLPIPGIQSLAWPFPMPRWHTAIVDRADAVLSVGGDNYSLDYRLPSVLMGQDRSAMNRGQPVTLWGASVGPFEREPGFVPSVTHHLARMRKLFVRESASYDYLTHTLELDNVEQMFDPAFALPSEWIDLEAFWPEAGAQGVVGVNVSPLLARYRKSGVSIIEEITRFIRYLVNEQAYGVLLIPHVIPFDGSEKNNDHRYLSDVLERCRDLGQSVRITPASLNAPQLKYAIQSLRFFIGARTHATIAALSSGVPTLSIGYSVKASGINRDLFGDEECVIPISDLSEGRLRQTFTALQGQEEHLRGVLAQVMRRYHRTLPETLYSLRQAL
jgi:colanic acid/amylovoran biosynthesis protein